MDKLDFKKIDKLLYSGKAGRWDRVQVPRMTFLAIEGQGDPNGPDYAAALGLLYPLAYGAKFAAKAEGADFVVPPLEALWWADDPGAFVSGDRAQWQWRAMLRMPEGVSGDDVEAVRATVLGKLQKKCADVSRLPDVQLVRIEEGDCLQTLPIGP